MSQDELVTVIVEIPAGTRNKYEWDAKSGRIFLSRTLSTAMRYPGEYGFIEGTLASDGDALDALVLTLEPTFPGCCINARPVAVFRMSDSKGRDEKIICVATRDPLHGSIHDLNEIPKNLRLQIEHFFQAYKALDVSGTDTYGFGDRAEAISLIESTRI